MKINIVKKLARLWLLLAATAMVLPEQAMAQLEITENFSTFLSGFSLNRRFGWWVNNAAGGLEGQHLNNRNAATSHYDPAQILNNPFLPPNFPASEISPIDGNISYYEVTYSNPFDGAGTDPDTGEPTGKNGGGNGILLELDVPETDAQFNPASFNATTYDNSDPNQRGQATFSIDYKVVMFDPSDHTVPTGAATTGNPTHPSDPMPYLVSDNTDQPVSANFSVLFLDRTDTGECSSGPACWNRIGGVGDPGDPFSGLDTDDLRRDEFASSGGQVFSAAELTEVELNTDGEIHTLELPFVFLTAAERAAMEWTGDTRGGPPAPGDSDWNDPDIFHNLRINTNGGGPRIVVWDNIRITVIPEPSTAMLVLLSAGVLGGFTRRR